MKRNPRYVILRNLKEQLQTHQIYLRVNNPHNMKVFMQGHVYAVWDFMLLLKQLQRRLTCVDKIWTPPTNINTARFINEIVVGEESDQHPSGHGFISHFQLYIEAMKEVGANTSTIQDFICQVRAGKDPITTLDNPQIPNYARKFVSNTLNAINKPTPYVAAQFFYGREDPIPQMFQKFVSTLQGKKNCQSLKYYLKRHIQIDGNEHGPLAQKLMEDLARQQDKEYNKIMDGAINAVQNRIKFWDGICTDLK